MPAGSVLVLLAACAGPTLEVETGGEDIPIFLDGALRGRGRLRIPAPYCGTVEVVAAPPESAGPRAREGRALVDVDEPVTPWIFPLDLAAEVLLHPVLGPERASVRLSPRPRRLPVSGVVPQHVVKLRRRARRAVLER